MISAWCSGGARRLGGGVLWLRQFFNCIETPTSTQQAVVLPDALLTARDAKVLVPAEGVSASCARPGVVVVPELQGNPEAESYAEMYVDDMLNLESCERENKGRLIIATFSAILNHFKMFGNSNENRVPFLSQKK